MRICIFTTAHPIDDVRVYEKFCKSFLSSGHHVTWVGVESRHIDSGFQLATGVDYRLIGPPTSKLARVLGWWKLFAKARSLKNIDLIYAPDPDAAAIGLILAKFGNARLAFDIHENYHDTSLQRWLGRLALPWVVGSFKRMVQEIARRSDVVIAVNDMIKDCYASNHKNAMVARNCPPRDFLSSCPAVPTTESPPSPVTYIMHGKAETGRGTQQVLEAIGGVGGGSAKVVMISSGEAGASAEARNIKRLMENNADRLKIISPIPNHEMALALKSCKAGLISYQRDLGVDSLPNRLFEYMACGIAVVAPSYSSEIAKILNEERCGLLVDFERPEEIARAISEIVADPERAREMGMRGHTGFLVRHNWESEFARVSNAIYG